MPIRGLIVRESLRDRRIPEQLASNITRCYPHALGGEDPVEIVELEVEAADLLQVAFGLSDRLVPRKYYCHFVDSEQMLVVFPGCVCTVRIGDGEGAGRCRSIGALFGIPESQMRFEEMFHHDHPDHD